jgi:hypothetical protein
MIQGTSKIKDESSYRSISMDSSSSLKDFSLDRKKYFRRWIMGEDIEEKDTQAIVIGKLVEVLLLEADTFDSKFYMSAISSAPTGLMLEFTEALYRITKEATNNEGEVTRSFEDISRDAYVESGFKIKYEAVINKFENSDAEIYYNEIRQVRAKNLIVVTANDVTNAERIVEELKTNFVTKDIINLVDSKRWEVKKQFQIEGYQLQEHLFKSMIDLIIIDHEEKTITPWDLKCVWNVEGFYEDYYLYRRAYIQAYLYYMACIYFTLINSEKYVEYKVLPTKFIVCDSINYYNPLIYTLSMDDMTDAVKGFEYKGRKYPGIYSIIEDLKFALDQNIWNISRENFLSKGIVNIKKI